MEEAISQKIYKVDEPIKKSTSYKEAGVDIDSGNAFVEAIKPLVKGTERLGVASELGGFGGVFDLKRSGYIDPLLVAATDGVGTKLLIAGIMDNHKTIGIDLVAMCVNDLIVQGAEPLFFLDYLATGKLDLKAAKNLISGITDGCIQANCSLIGGETAEMPGLYRDGHYDLAGFAVGAVERKKLIKADAVKYKDVIFGLASTGIHSNGYSLVRRIIENSKINYYDTSPFDKNVSIGQVLLTPTRIYVESCLNALATGGIHAFAHITGGGLLENIPRVLPKGLSAYIDLKKWPMPAIYQWLSKTGKISPIEMIRTFNCGIGMVVISAPDIADDIEKTFEESGETIFRIGKVIKETGEKEKIFFENLKDGWNL